MNNNANRQTLSFHIWFFFLSLSMIMNIVFARPRAKNISVSTLSSCIHEHAISEMMSCKINVDCIEITGQPDLLTNFTIGMLFKCYYKKKSFSVPFATRCFYCNYRRGSHHAITLGTLSGILHNASCPIN